MYNLDKCISLVQFKVIVEYSNMSGLRRKSIILIEPVYFWILIKKI